MASIAAASTGLRWSEGGANTVVTPGSMRATSNQGLTSVTATSSTRRFCSWFIWCTSAPCTLAASYFFLPGPATRPRLYMLSVAVPVHTRRILTEAASQPALNSSGMRLSVGAVAAMAS